MIVTWTEKYTDGRTMRFVPVGSVNDPKNFLEHEYRYKLPKIGMKTDKGKWLNAFANKFFKKDHDYKYKGKIHIKRKNTYFKMNNKPGVLVQWFKNLKKLKQHHFEGEVFNAQLYKEQFKEAA